MKQIAKIAAVAAFGLLGGQVSAATLDFVAEANGNERGVASGFVLNNANTGGINVTITSNYNPYFDSGNAGLGVCKILDSSAQCDPSNDDNVTSGEWVKLTFDSAVTLSGLSFRNANHNLINTSNSTLRIGIDGAMAASTTFASAAGAIFTGITSIQFKYGGNHPDQFYLSAANVAPVPVPASLPLLVGALGVMGFGARRRKKAAA
ncbi:MAG: VPLPA-CTERM sorting domain-containing protein [Paracoccaceae bacterium]|jgi:hypothetical protein|nr:VPLPA-CTERM sorting domain-containing protein [Paracoccaceae bacterium]